MNIYLKEILWLIISIPLGILLNYYVTSDLLIRVALFPTFVYVIILVCQIFVIYEVFKFFFTKWNKIDKIILTGIYFFVLFLVMFARIPLETRVYQWNPIAFLSDNYAYVNGGFLIPLFNVLMFVPMITILSFWKNNIKYLFSIGFIIGASIEIIQVITMRGMFDVSDIILYTIGMVVGMWLYQFVNEKIV